MAEQMELIVVEQRGEEQFLTVAGQHLKAVEVFTGPDGVEKIIADIEAQVKAFQPDVSTAKGRKEIAAMAYKVSQSKVVLFNLGKSLTADWKAKAKKVDDAKATVTERLDALRDATRAPLTEWEEAEKAREAAEKLAKAIEEAHAAAIREAQRKEREAKEAAEQAEFERVAAEARMERERITALKLAEEEKAAAVRAAEEKARREAEAKEAERLRQEREAAAKLEAERKEAERKAADVEHRRTINKEAVASLMEATSLTKEQAQNVIGVIVGKLVKHVNIQY